MKPDNTQETIYVGLDTGLPPYLPYPRFLLKMDISQTAKLLYALLLDRTTLSQRNGWQDDQGRTFIVYPIAEIAEMLDKGQTAIKAALNELDAAGLLERKRAGDDAYKDSFFINANSTTQPGIVDAHCQHILERSEVYSGVYGRASISFYAFNSNGNKGIACSLNNLQKIRDGEPLGGKPRAEDDFATVDEDDFLA